MSVTWREAGLRVRDVLLAIVIVSLLVTAVWINRDVARSKTSSVSPRLRICVSVRRALEPGTILDKTVLETRLARTYDRGPGYAGHFDDVDDLVGRQLSHEANRGAVLYPDMLVDTDFAGTPEEKLPVAGTFFVVVPGRSAQCIGKGAKILLTAEGKKTDLRTIPEFEVVADPVEMPKAKESDIADLRLQLKAEYVGDAMRILSVAESSKLVPIVTGGAIQCPGEK